MRNFATGLQSVLTLSLLWAAVACPAAGAEGLVLHVAPNGNDGWSGRVAAPKDGDGPFRTLERARDELRNIKKAGTLPAGGIVVELGGGSYPLAGPLALSAEDSGTASAPIQWRRGPAKKCGFPEACGSIISGRSPIRRCSNGLMRRPAARCWKPICARRESRTSGKWPATIASSLFFQDKPMTLARWPNDGLRAYRRPGGRQAGRRPRHRRRCDRQVHL